MGHDGMLYSLPSREIIADSVEYMVNAHCADAMVCISNCDKITPGMLMAALRLNMPTVFVSGGPMEGGRARAGGGDASGGPRPGGVPALGGPRKLYCHTPWLALPDLRVPGGAWAGMEKPACPAAAPA